MSFFVCEGFVKHLKKVKVLLLRSHTIDLEGVKILQKHQDEDVEFSSTIFSSLMQNVMRYRLHEDKRDL